MMNRTLFTLAPRTYLTLFTCSLLLTSFIHSHENHTVTTSEATHSTVDSTLQTLLTGVTSRKGIDARRWLTTQLKQQLNILTLKKFTKLALSLFFSNTVKSKQKEIIAQSIINSTTDTIGTFEHKILGTCVVCTCDTQEITTNRVTSAQKNAVQLLMKKILRDYKDKTNKNICAQKSFTEYRGILPDEFFNQLCMQFAQSKDGVQAIADKIWSEYKTLRKENGRSVDAIIQELFDKYKKMLPDELFKEAWSGVLPDITDAIENQILDTLGKKETLSKQHDDSQVGTIAKVIKNSFAAYQKILPDPQFKEILQSKLMNEALLLGLGNAGRAEDKDTITALLTHVFDADLLKRETKKEDPHDFKTPFVISLYIPIMRQCLGKHINYVDHETKQSLLDIVSKQVQKENGKYLETEKYFTYTAPHPGRLQKVYDIHVKRQTAISGLRELGAKTYAEQLHTKK